MSHPHVPLPAHDPAVDLLLARPDVREAQFHRLFEDAPTGIAFVARDGKYLRVNRAYCNLVGYAESELVDRRRWQDITHPDDVAADEAESEQVAAGENSTYRMVKRYICKRGRVVTVDLQVDRVDDASGLFVHFIAHASPLPMNEDFYRIDRSGEIATIRPFYPLARLVADNWKVVVASVVVTAGTAAGAVHSYYSTVARLEVQQATVEAQKTALDDHRKQIELLRAEIDAVRSRPK